MKLSRIEGIWIVRKGLSIYKAKDLTDAINFIKKEIEK